VAALFTYQLIRQGCNIFIIFDQARFGNTIIKTNAGNLSIRPLFFQAHQRAMAECLFRLVDALAAQLGSVGTAVPVCTAVCSHQLQKKCRLVYPFCPAYCYYQRFCEQYAHQAQFFPAAALQRAFTGWQHTHTGGLPAPKFQLYFFPRSKSFCTGNLPLYHPQKATGQKDALVVCLGFFHHLCTGICGGALPAGRNLRGNNWNFNRIFAGSIGK
jgi:hypothetical protein